MGRNNRMGDRHETQHPRAQIAGNKDFGFIRSLDGHAAHMQGRSGANVHRPNAQTMAEEYPEVFDHDEDY